jgi:hypothetical protein
MQMNIVWWMSEWERRKEAEMKSHELFEKPRSEYILI